ncbi:cbb3-type cytochrome oxidase assembly protein CcoS [Altererythrobacter aerius]|uniref:Cbb3-type cytochrome oxidase assembly protein CcoS n=1 Tax=Tsuneonella aeria TaxID=1837929 RepID=A0A6I4TFK6_9SPHN|nr:cbb3-type cytochrome oxidase assembly protein CcoS [Tsuneonella aeria]
MNGLAVLIPVALGLGLLGLIVFFWAMRAGQFEDLDGAANRILIEDEGEFGDEDDDQGARDDAGEGGPRTPG